MTAIAEILQLPAGQAESLLVAAAVFVLGVVIARLLVLALDRYMPALTERTPTDVDKIVLEAINAPLFWLLTITAARIAVEQLDFLSDATVNVVDSVIFVLYVVAGYVLLYRLLGDLLAWYAEDLAKTTDTSLDDLLIPFLRRVLLVTLTLIVAIILLDRFGVPVGSLLATLGVGSLAVALAAQQSLRDVISGILLVFDRPYTIGDRIFIPQAEVLGGDVLGDVMDIGLRSTRIITRDNRLVIVPNSVMAETLIVNLAYPDRRLRLDVPVGVAYGTDIEGVRQVLIDSVRPLSGILPEPPPRVLVRELGDSAIFLRVRCWIDSYADLRTMQDHIATAAYTALNEAGIEMPYPQRTVWHRVEEERVDGLRRALGGLTREL